MIKDNYIIKNSYILNAFSNKSFADFEGDISIDPLSSEKMVDYSSIDRNGAQVEEKEIFEGYNEFLDELIQEGIQSLKEFN